MHKNIVALVPLDLHRRFKTAVAENGQSIKSEIRNFIEKYLAEKTAKETEHG